MDTCALTDGQMSDFQFWALFPNVFIQVRAGEATMILAKPDSEGDPNRCIWQVTSFLWVPPEGRLARREPLTQVVAGAPMTAPPGAGAAECRLTQTRSWLSWAGQAASS